MLPWVEPETAGQREAVQGGDSRSLSDSRNQDYGISLGSQDSGSSRDSIGFDGVKNIFIIFRSAVCISTVVI